jgi:hypothetical protein
VVRAARGSAGLLTQAGGPVRWPDVMRALYSDETRAKALDRYRSDGHTPDDFARSRAAREAMADALTRTEDWLEDEHPRWPDRASIKAVRRRLEWELWP